MAGHVFMSHGSDNREDAEALADFLESHGVTMWIAPRDVRPGQDYSEQLQGAIEGCVAFVVLVTEMANKSPYVRAETEMAFSGGKPIFPVRLTDIKPAAGLAFFLKIRHWTDAYGKSRDANLDRLAQELRTLSGAEAPEAEPAPVPAAAPASSAPPPPPPAAAPDQELVVAALGANADYFLKHWAKADASGKSYDWNWAACFLNFCWFAYRKMWLAAAAIGFIYVVTTPLLDPARNLRLFQVTMLALVGLSFVTGGWGNMFYRRQIERRVAATASMGREEALARLRKEGGTSVPGLVISIVAIMGLSLIVSIMMLLAGGKLPAGPAPAPDPAPAPAPAAAGPPALDEAYLVGRWSDSGDCNHSFEFTADGHFYGADGGAGNWTLNGNELTASGPGGAATMRLQPIDQNTMTVTAANGQTSNPIRC